MCIGKRGWKCARPDPSSESLAPCSVGSGKPGRAYHGDDTFRSGLREGHSGSSRGLSASLDEVFVEWGVTMRKDSGHLHKRCLEHEVS